MKNSILLSRSVSKSTCTGLKAMSLQIRGRAYQTQEQQAKLASVTQQLAPHYASVAAALFARDIVQCGRDDRA